ncbi:DinB family protein [Pedobacter aquatilis]|uniref:DinB family protein n=1 Tax=Pedobacter aquatilis TaxID=351343 RepID=UPI0025B4150F|nr:DinB family protein [Pedobacter aquatilis]MDN3587916.1 DinB family protein [Pedobacter aquatilis]
MGEEVKNMLLTQYDNVLYSRNTIIEYVKLISIEDFTTENSSFGRGSVRNLLVHICDTYAAWIGLRGLNLPIDFKPFSAYDNIQDCVAYFNQVDEYVYAFLQKFEYDYQQEIEIERNGDILKISPLRLFTHTITHEFHHKGQIMSLSRHLGYTPVDADIIR